MTSSMLRQAELAGPDWVRDAVFYQVFPDRFDNGDANNDPRDVVPWESAPTRENFFGGDLAGVQRRLPYLERLGITALYLTPIFKAGTNHRYDAHDYLEIDPSLGDEGSLRALVDDAHARGIRVVLDGVFNHAGDGFWAFRDVIERGSHSAYWNWFFVERFPIVREPPSYQTCGGTPYLPKLNTSDPALRSYLLGVAAHWIERAGIDGWRLDVPWKVPLEFWAELRQMVKSAKPDAYLVGEIWHSWERWLDVFDGLMNYRLRGHLHDFCLREAFDAEDLAHETAAYLRDAPSGDFMLNLLGSHDTPRLLTLAGGDQRRAILALTALFTYPGTPMLYYGDEIGLEGGDDPDCRRPMIWDERRWRQPIHAAVQRLIAARRTSVALRRGDWQALLAFNRVIAYSRAIEGDHAIVALNGGRATENIKIPLRQFARASGYEDVLSGRPYAVSAGSLSLEIEPFAAFVLVPARGRA